MTEITREVLLGMGFNFFRPDEGIVDGWWEYEHGDDDVTLTYDTGFCALVTVDDRVDISQKVDTLPQLRQLIRSLFGDDALPRRELSSITDEEAIHLSTHEWPYQHGLCIRNVSRYDYGLFVTVGGDDDCISGTHLLEINWEDGSIDADRLVIKHIYADLLSMDFHLPAFHGDKGGE